MPQVNRSFYADEEYGPRYFTFLSEELPAMVGSMFRVANERESTFVAGLSMGGYGALKWALQRPQRFAAAASLSGASNIAHSVLRRHRPEDPRMAERIFGDRDVALGPDNIEWLIEHLEPDDQADLPRLYLCCGTEDDLYADNQSLVRACENAGIAITSKFSPGAHEWAYWDDQIQDVLAWMFADRPTAEAQETIVDE